jgi:hypothetical protein
MRAAPAVDADPDATARAYDRRRPARLPTPAVTRGRVAADESAAPCEPISHSVVSYPVTSVERASLILAMFWIEKNAEQRIDEGGEWRSGVWRRSNAVEDLQGIL